jgi:chromosome segregation ATPase
MAKQDWVGYEEEHAQFDNQILDIHKKLADFEKEKNEITQSITTLNSELNELELEVIPEINTQISKLSKAGVAMTMAQLKNQKNDLLNQVEEMAKDDWVGFEEERTQFDIQMLVIETKLDGLGSGKNEIIQSVTTLNSEITQSATTLNFDRSDIAESSIKDLVENPEVIKQISELSIEFNNANNVVDIIGDVARAMEGLSVEADVALSMVDLQQQKNVLFDQVEEMAKQDWVGYEEEHAQFDNQILDINKKLADIEKSGQ